MPVLIGNRDRRMDRGIPKRRHRYRWQRRPDRGHSSNTNVNRNGGNHGVVWEQLAAATSHCADAVICHFSVSDVFTVIMSRICKGLTKTPWLHTFRIANEKRA
jgi:hypothetical protein